MERGEDFRAAWNGAVKEKGKESGLTGQDRELLAGFGEGLGRSDVEGQMANCDLYGGLLADRLEEARREAAAKQRLYLTLGVAGGLALALLLL